MTQLRICARGGHRWRDRKTPPRRSAQIGQTYVCCFDQTPLVNGCSLPAKSSPRWRDSFTHPCNRKGYGVMLKSQRYRDYATDCVLSALQASEPHCRQLHLSLAASWVELANQDEAVSKLLSSWGVTAPTEATLVSGSSEYDADGAASAWSVR